MYKTGGIMKSNNLKTISVLVLAVVLGFIAPTSASATAKVDKTAIPKYFLTEDEIADGDITNSAEGQNLILTQLDSEQNLQPMRAFKFGETKVVVSAAVKLNVVKTFDNHGDVLYEVFPIAQGVKFSGAAGFVVPPNSEFAYHSEDQITSVLGTWIRKIWWTMQKANNYSCTNCGTYDYWRIYGRIQGSTETGTSSNFGYKRLWLEFNLDNTTSGYEYEPVKPVESYAGPGNTTTTIGFGAGVDISLGSAPKMASVGLDASYAGSVTRSTENWHPVIRAESGSGGVQWCYYVGENWFTGDDQEFTGTRTLTTRASVRFSSSSSAPIWHIRYGMEDRYTNCPSQL